MELIYTPAYEIAAQRAYEFELKMQLRAAYRESAALGANIVQAGDIEHAKHCAYLAAKKAAYVSRVGLDIWSKEACEARRGNGVHAWDVQLLEETFDVYASDEYIESVRAAEAAASLVTGNFLRAAGFGYIAVQ
jgi:hypothetical protein